jgi:hypothetical protein
MNAFLILVIYIGVLALITYVLSRRRAKKDTQLIIEYLAQKGATDIVAKWDQHGGDRGNQAYDIEYTDRKGERRTTGCKVSSPLFSDGEIYWRDPPEV